MNQLSKEAKKIFLSILEQLGNETYMKINVNGRDSSLMPLVVEVKATGLQHQGNNNCFVVSLAHYYEQNGDLMSDPYMEFFVSDYRHVIEPQNAGNVNHILDAVGVWPSCFEQHGIFAKYIELIILRMARQPDTPVKP